jgi:hypothetical protein
MRLQNLLSKRVKDLEVLS